MLAIHDDQIERYGGAPGVRDRGGLLLPPRAGEGWDGGHDRFDMALHDRYFADALENFAYPSKVVKASLAHLQKLG